MKRIPKYDDELDREPIEEQIDPCVHKFVKSTEIVREYNPDLCNQLIEYGREGLLFIDGFAGKYNVCVDKIWEWINSTEEEYEDFRSAYKICVTACIHYWNEELVYAVNNRDWQAVTAIRNILSEVVKTVSKGVKEGVLAGNVPEDADEKAKKQQLQIQQRALSLLSGNGEEATAV